MSFDSDRPTKKRKIEPHSHASSPIQSSPMEGLEKTTSGDEKTQQENLKCATWIATAYGESHSSLRSGTRAVRANALPQTPWTDGNLSERLPGRIRTPCRYRVNVVVPHTPDSLLPPQDAPLLESKRHADYFPWMGNHLEDTITAEVVKSGYWDKAPAPLEKESNTARAPLYNAFKNRSGLEALSSVFGLVLEKKSKHGSLSSTTTFRPPPRVTLTEAKRRSWIADLADASVPLKRLSRTIPQGIRGLALLEQCSINTVPLNRAIWFVKCVGANEIRTLKRKGVNASITASAEIKWLREWTVNIEQFLEAAIGSNESEQWAEVFTYCLQLCTRMYQESLMDKDHFLDWLAKNLGSCNTEMFAAWLPVYQLFRNDLVKFRKRGRQIAGIFLARLKQLGDWPSTSNYLKTRLQFAINSLVHLKPACFLMPDRWEQYRKILRECLGPSNSKDERLYEFIEKRNERMLRMEDSNNDTVSPDKSVFEILDKFSALTNIRKTSSDILSCSNDFFRLCDVSLQWATSRFRGGMSRIYLVARLLRRWHRDGHDIDTPLLAYFSRNHDPVTLNLDDYRHLFAELSRTNAFSRSRFLQALSVQKSTIRDQSSKQQDCTFLLRDLCLNEGEDHMGHLKQYLLSAYAQYSPEDNTLSFFITRLQKLLVSNEQESTSAFLTDAENTQLGDMDWSSKFEVCRWLRDQAIDLSKFAEMEISGKPALPGSRSLTLNQFLVIRNVLETAGDISILADVLRILSNTRQEHILACMVDAVHYHAQSLAAIGAFEALQSLYSQAYVALRATRPCMLLFVTSLLDLCLYYPCQITPTRALQHDLIKGDRARALSACSPFSDGVAESLQQAGETFIDDFEAILQGEPNMSEQTMTSLFTVLIGRIMKSDAVSTTHNTFMLCQLLSRLRLNRIVQADTLIKRWLTRLFTAAWSGLHTNIILELLNTRCITLSALFEISGSAPPASKCREAIANLVLDGLLQDTEPIGRNKNFYVLRIAAQHLIATDPICGLELMLSKCEVNQQSLGIYATVLSSLFQDSVKLSSLPTNVSGNLPKILYQMLDLDSSTVVASHQFLSRMSWLSLPFCRSVIGMQEKPTDTVAGGNTADETNVVLKSIGLHSDLDAVDLELSQAMIQSMPDGVQDHIRTLVERQFYESMPKIFHAKAISQPTQLTLDERAQSLRSANRVVALGPARNGSAPGDSNGLMLEKLTVIARALGAKNDIPAVNLNLGQNAPSPGSPAINQNSTISSQIVDGRFRDTVFSMLEYLYMLLKILSMRASLFTGGQNSTLLPKTMQNEQIKLVFCLLTIATQPSLAAFLQTNVEDVFKERIRECIGFTLDVAARLVDDFSDEARIVCAKLMKDRLKDERVAWLVGSMASCANLERGTENGLVVMHETKGYVGEFRPKKWELLENGGGKENDGCLGLGLFGAKKV